MRRIVMVDGFDTKQANRALVLRRLVLAGAVPRGALVREVGLSKATVSRVVDDLIDLGLAREEGPSPATARRGPRPAVVAFRAEEWVICGVDLGATNVRILASDLAGRVLAVERLPIPAGLDRVRLAGWLKDRVVRAAPREESIRATAIGVPGVVHPATDEIRHADNLPAINGSAAFSDSLKSVFPGKLVLGNDANLAVLGEAAFGAARGHSSAVMFTLGTGVGTGVLVGGQPFTGRSGLVGEFAYLRLPLPDGTAVPLEELLGAPALLRKAADLGHPVTTPAAIFDPAGPPALKGLRQQALEALQGLLTTVTLAYEPEIIVLGGGVGPSLTSWLPDLQTRLTADVPEAPLVVPSELGDFVGALGALALAWQEALAALGLGRPVLDSAPAAPLGLVPGALPLAGSRECE